MTHNFSVWIKGETEPLLLRKSEHDLFRGGSVTQTIFTDFYECSVTWDRVLKKHFNEYHDRRFFTFAPSNVQKGRGIGSPTGIVGCHGFKKAVRVYSDGRIESGYYGGHDTHDSAYGDGILYLLYQQAFQGLDLEFFRSVEHEYAGENELGIYSIVCFDRSDKLEYEKRYVIRDLESKRNPLLNTKAVILLPSHDERTLQEDDRIEFIALAPDEFGGQIFEKRDPEDVKNERASVKSYIREYFGNCTPSFTPDDMKKGGLIDKVSYRADGRFDPDDVAISRETDKAIDTKYPNMLSKMGLGWAFNSPRRYEKSEELLRIAYGIWKRSKIMDKSERVEPTELFDENIRVWIFAHLFQYVKEQYPNGSFPKHYLAQKLAESVSRDIRPFGNDLKSDENKAHRSIRWYYEFLREFIYTGD